ncbi:MAG: hypothetical protein NWF07_14170 [Candidatus Bathyarchaeota archaeon]|nr:hypothetical protein [Candidatus Bathyarchaeota archaeon]
MKTTKKMMVSALLIMAVLSVGLTPIFAAPDTSRGATVSAQKAQKGNMVQQMSVKGNAIRSRIQAELQGMQEPIDITDLDEATIDDVIAEVEAAEALDDDEEATIVWYLNARGQATVLSPVTDAAQVNEPLGVQLIAEKVKTTEFGKLYKVLWGRINHMGVKVEIEGYAVLDTDGVFYMKLEGEDISFKSIGRISPAGIGVKVAMKGYMTHEDIDYSFTMHGRAIPLRGNMIRNRIQNQLTPEESMESDTGSRWRVTPNTETA